MPTACLSPAAKVRHYGHQLVNLSLTRYLRNGRLCLRLVAADGSADPEVRAVCSVNLPQVPMRDDELAIKTWYENVGMLGWLMDQGIVSEPQHYAYFANTFIPVCRLLIEAPSEKP